MDLLAMATGISEWAGDQTEPAMVVHLPDGRQVARFGDERRWEEYSNKFGADSLRFWHWQERTADALWNLALRLPSWPPANMAEASCLASVGMGWLVDKPVNRQPRLALDAFRPVATHLQGLPESLRLFMDAQLLISAQADSSQANALYGAAALDLPRRGVLHLKGGMGAIAERLVQAVRDNGGRVLYRQEARRIRMERGKAVAVETRRGEVYDADIVITNLTPWNVTELLEGQVPARLRRLPAKPPANWGAFVVYLGMDGGAIPHGFPLHHQIIQRRPLGEGNTLFVSLSPEWDVSHAPQGKRALTLSTHTNLDSWWQLQQSNPEAYEIRQAQYTENLLAIAERAVPNLRQAAELVLPGTPVTFQKFTRRARGWVGGFQQTNLLGALGPRLEANLWMVGDSIFPGQSVAATALGGLRVAEAVMGEQKLPMTARKMSLKAAV
jgi:phytoene dehydrogenase-like protein